jgi:transcriptional regulator with XRE-family HTH domain
MHQKETPKPNQLDLYRRRMRFSMSQVAHLLGHKGTSVLSNYERGLRLPTLVNALKLSIILRVPVEFLFGALYDGLRGQIRAEEEFATPVQQVLF